MTRNHLIIGDIAALLSIFIIELLLIFGGAAYGEHHYEQYQERVERGSK